jgi:transcriptional regulator with XRE-family HTH domain
MTVDPLAFGVLLRRWRERRRLTQTDLALAANSSTRHLSYLETGKSQPSRAMIARLAELLEVPLRERNALLLAAGFAPAFRETALDALDAAKSAMDRILRAHLPYPAFAVDRHWNVVLSNGAMPQLYEGCSETLLAQPINAIRLMLHPDGMGPKILNFSAWRQHCLAILRQQIEARADSKLQALYAEVAAYPVPPGGGDPGGGERGGFEDAERLATPLRLATRFGTLSFLSTVTVFGTASDITLAELALEMLFPADDQTAEIANLMELERNDQPPASAQRIPANRL